ncbi:hypothetical protein AGMMS49940_10380 [Spirochaetia bacterium]|nr:hypothetical protein AGMMS49940_10380 [Spirochaetia bacterium]
MPSLEQLKNFKASFGAIADEAMVLAQLEQPPDDLPLPNSEPVAPPPPQEPAFPEDLDPGIDLDVGTSPEESAVESGLDFDFADLLGSGPDNLTPPPAAETALEEALSADAISAEAAAPPLDIPDVSFDDDFSGLGDSVAETAVPGGADSEAPADNADADLDFSDLGEDLPDFGFSSDEPETIPVDNAGIDLDFPDLNADSPEAAPGATGGEAPADSAGADLDFSDLGENLPDFGFSSDEPETIPVDNAGINLDFPDLNADSPEAAPGATDGKAPADNVGADLDFPDLGEDLPDFGFSSGEPETVPVDSAGIDLDIPDLNADSPEAAPGATDGKAPADNAGADLDFPDLGEDLPDFGFSSDEPETIPVDNAGINLDFPDLNADSPEVAPGATDGKAPEPSTEGSPLEPSTEGSPLDTDDNSGAMDALLGGFADEIEAASPEPVTEEDFGDAFPDIADINLEEGGGDEGEFPVPDLGVDISPEGVPGEGAFPEGALTEGAVEGDPFEGFSPDGGDAGLSGGDGTGTADEGIPDMDFALPGLDEVLGGNAPGGETGAAPAVDFAAEAFMPEVTASDVSDEAVEEISLSEGDFDRLRETIAGYPLNLRIAVEEIIAEQVIAPNLMSSLIKLLVRGGSPREAASLAGKILNRSIPVPRGFEKKTGEDLEQEQASFPYVFTHKFLPVLRLFLVIAILAASVFYLGYTFIYTPLRANSIYKQGYELIPTGAYAQANERFNRAFQRHRQKNWFYKYAEAFRDERQYIYAEEKYDQLLTHYPGDKKGALDYANMETYYLRNYDKANRIIRRNILELSADDREGLLALGDNNLLWGEQSEAEAKAAAARRQEEIRLRAEAEKTVHYEDARSAYARLLEVYGWQDPIVERMLRYFIRVDNLGEVLPLQQYFMSDPKRRKISAITLADLGGYLLDKRFEEVRGVPDEHIGQIGGIRDILLRAVQASPRLPEAHYHLARYYNHFGSSVEERQTLEIAVRAFDAAPEESARRTGYRLSAQCRMGEILINSREFFAAEEQLIKGIGIYEDALDRRFLTPDPQFGKLYADLGDLEYFTRSGNMPQAVEYYLKAEQNGWSPPEMQYRIGSAYYQQGQWAPALDRFFAVSSAIPPNRRLLNALGNVSYLRGNYFAAQGYYNRLLDILDSERARFPVLMPNDRPEHLELVERMMVARNNLAVALEALTKATGNRSYRSRALGLYTESARAWDSLTRNPTSMIRAGAGDFSSPGMNLAFLNSRNTLYPEPGYEPHLYIQIDKDVLEPSAWEELVPGDFRLTEVLEPYLPR